MRVLQIINSLHMGGAEKILFDLSLGLRDIGVDVDVYLLEDVDNIYKTELLKSGISVTALGKKGGNVYNPTIYIIKLIRNLHKYDIVHVHLFPAQYWAAFANFLSLQKPVLITTEHSTHNKRREIKYFKKIEKFIYSQYAKIICVADISKEILTKYLKDEKNRCISIPNGVNISKYIDAQPLFRERIGLQESDKILLMVAGFREMKQQETVIEALRYLPPDFKAIFVGDGERRSYCERYAIELKVNDRVLFLGTRTDVPNLLHTADIIIMSSHYEGLSLSSIEGMCAGKPFIASDVPGLKEVVFNAGILFPEKDAQCLASICEHLINDRDYYNIIANRCLERAQNYDITEMIKKYYSVYKELYENRKV